MKFEEIGLESKVEEIPVKISEDIELHVPAYLSIADKTDFIQFVVDSALDDNTGCFSPIRTRVYCGLAICKWYGGIEFSLDELAHADATYDLLDTNGVITKILEVIPDKEWKTITKLVRDTIKDIARYNSSAAGIIKMASLETSGLNVQVKKMLDEIKEGKGLENLSAIKNVVGTD